MNRNESTRGRRIAVSPFGEKDVDFNKNDIQDQQTGWGDGNNARDLNYLYFLGDILPEGETKNFLGMLKDVNDVLYVIGHCGSGFSHLTATDNGGKTADAVRITDLLFRAGLPLTFPGRIKIYACESGDSYGAAIPFFGSGRLINGIGPAFTQQIANTMALKGYKSCKFWGYLHSISVNKRDGQDGSHKRIVGEKNAGARAKSCQLQFHPQI